MKQKITKTKNIRQQLEKLYQQKYNDYKLPQSKPRKYKGLGLNWRDSVILLLALFFIGLYQVQAHSTSLTINELKQPNISKIQQA